MNDDAVLTTIDSMLQLNSELVRNIADTRHYYKEQAQGGTAGTAYKLYTDEVTRNFSSLGELVTLLGTQLQAV